ncbi:MAG: hypothetical protein HYU99_01925 [Deltaproteobacteria bacterium]|nr:hypothetical protein [Deltaproteobacteria bacterium]
MVVERIDKTDRFEYWKVQSFTETQKDRQSGHDASKDAFQAFGEKTDWELLFDKSRLWKRGIQVARDEIGAIVFRKINLKTDPSLLRVDVELKGGGNISPAFVSISRATGLKIKNLQPGDRIPEEQVLHNDILYITVPANPELFREEEKKIAGESKKTSVPAEEATVKKNVTPDPLRPEMLLVYGVAVLMILLIIGGYLLIR